jgi:multisubunit Na+/H+ antiporter MnhC subunit
MILGTAIVIGAVTVIVITACFRAAGISIKTNSIKMKDNNKIH